MHRAAHFFHQQYTISSKFPERSCFNQTSHEEGLEYRNHSPPWRQWTAWVWTWVQGMLTGSWKYLRTWQSRSKIKICWAKDLKYMNALDLNLLQAHFGDRQRILVSLHGDQWKLQFWSLTALLLCVQDSEGPPVGHFVPVRWSRAGASLDIINESWLQDSMGAPARPFLLTDAGKSGWSEWHRLCPLWPQPSC